MKVWAGAVSKVILFYFPLSIIRIDLAILNEERLHK